MVVLVALAAAGPVACGGGASAPSPVVGTSSAIATPAATPSPAPSPTPSPTPDLGPSAPAIPTPAPFTVTANVPLPLPTAPADPTAPTPTPIPLPMPSAGGIAATLELPIPLPGTDPSTTVDEDATNVIPDDTPGDLDHRRAPRNAANGTTPLLYLGVRMSSMVVLPAPPGFEVEVPAALIVPDADYYLAAYDPVASAAGWQRGYAGPAPLGTLTTTSAVGATKLSFVGASGPSGGRFVFVGRLRYWFAVYAQSHRRPPPTPPPTPVPTGSPVPTATPTASPVPGFTVTPSTIAFTAPGQTQIVTASAAGRSGSFTASTSSASVATVRATSTTAFIVTAATTAGTATVTITDSNHKTATVAVGLTITNGFIH